jgi:hypothetical protein
LIPLDTNKCLAKKHKNQSKGHPVPKKTIAAASGDSASSEAVLTLHPQNPSSSKPVTAATLTLRTVSNQTGPSSSVTDTKRRVAEGIDAKPASKPRYRERLQSYDGSKGQLQTQISKALIRNSPDGHKKFLPIGQLAENVTQQAIQGELGRCKNHMRKHEQKWRPLHAKEVCGDDPHKSYRKIFALLVLLDRPYDIVAFIKEDLHDGELPLVIEHGPQGSKPSLELRRRGSAEIQPLKCFEGWTERDIDDFARRQWAMLAPVFTKIEDKKDCHQLFSPETVLPFVSWEKGAHRSGHGQVYKVEIHPDHHDFGNLHGPKDMFAVKELYSDKKEFVLRKEDFKLEVETLRRLTRCDHAHDHLITLLTSYEQAERYFLIFPWAGADLLGYWKTVNSIPSQDKETSMWLATQCHGLADALSRIHRYDTLSATLLHPTSFARNGLTETGRTTSGNPLKLFGRHGDIKPNNILWFPEQNGRHGILKIADFGSVHFSTRDSVSSKDRNPIPNSATYQPPEWDLDDVRMLRSSYDIWTLGCVYLEFITWFLGGYELLVDFAAKRQAADWRWWDIPEIQTDTFFTIEKDQWGSKKAKVKDPVLQVGVSPRSKLGR